MTAPAGATPEHAAAASAPNPSAARRTHVDLLVDDFELPDSFGQPWKLAESIGSRGLLLAFIGVECPIAQRAMSKLAALHAEFSPAGINVVAIDANVQDSLDELQAFRDRFAPPFPLLKDAGNQVADQVRAEHTPEVFLLDAERRVRYWGRLDDEFGFRHGLGYQRVLAVRNDVREAIEELLSGQPISVPEIPAAGCRIGRVREADADSPVTWSNQIVRIAQQHCQMCHRPGQIAPFPMITYEDVFGWQETIMEVVQEHRMPPWGANPNVGHFVNDPSLSAEKRELIYRWVDAGGPEGDPAELPPPIDFPQGWRLEDPDAVVFIQAEPTRIPAVGKPQFQFFNTDLIFDEGVWIGAVEVRPQNLSVVHHMEILAKPKGEDFETCLRAGKVVRLAGYVPGLSLVQREQEVISEQLNRHLQQTDSQMAAALYLPPGSQIVIDVHYKPNGREETDHSSIAIKFADGPGATATKPTEGDEATSDSALDVQLDVGGDEKLAASLRRAEQERAAGQQRVLEGISLLVENSEICVRPYLEAQPIDAWHTFEEDTLLCSLHGHMHTRGKSMEFVAYYPDGTEELLLDIAQYDYDWEHLYQLAEPKRMPKGTRLQVRAIFDNSPNNPRNPGPEAFVTYGRGYYDQEMMSGTIGFVPLVAASKPYAERQLGWGWQSAQRERKSAAEILAGYLAVDDVPADRRAEYYYRRALFRQFLLDEAGAIEDLTAAIEHEPNSRQVLLARAQAFLRDRRAELALRDLNALQKAHPREPKTYVELARLLPASAEEHLSRAIELDPLLGTAYFERAQRRAERGDLDGALADYGRIIDEVDPSMYDALLSRGMLLMQHSREAEGRKDFDRVIERWPSQQTKWDYCLGTTLANQRRWDEAAPHLRDYLHIVPESPTALRALAIATRELGLPDESLETLQKLSAVQPDDLAVAFELSQLLLTRAEFRPSPDQQWNYNAEAARLLERAVRRGSNSAEIRLSLALAWQRTGRASEAIAVSRRLLADEPDSPHARNNLAWMLATQANPTPQEAAEALDLAEEARRQLATPTVALLDTLAAAHATRGDFAAATQVAEQAIAAALEQDNKPQAARIERRLEKYRAGQRHVEALMPPEEAEPAEAQAGTRITAAP